MHQDQQQQTNDNKHEQEFQAEIGELVNNARREREQTIGALMHENMQLIEKVQQNFARVLIYATREEAEEAVLNMKNTHILTRNVRISFGAHIKRHVTGL